jgi:hypothetical protein
MTSPNIEVGYYSEAQFTRPSAECPNPELWHTWDIQGTEVEVIEMVAGLVRGLQPEVVLETGTSRGFMAYRVAMALRENGHGHLHTYEPNEATWGEAVANTVHVSDVVTLHNLPSMEPWEGGEIEFCWFDSLLELRWAEFDFYYPHMSDRCVVGFHDTAPHFGNWAAQVRFDDRLELINLPTPRGVILGRVLK